MDENEFEGASIMTAKKQTEKDRKAKDRDAAVADTILKQIDNAGNSATLQIDNAEIPFSNFDKVLWPGDADHKPVSKRDYVRYLYVVSEYLLPHLKDRPITLLRYPNGVDGKRFFQKHWEHKLPEFVETVDLFSEHNKADGEFLLCNNLPTLLWLGQLADLELHTIHTRLSAEPDGHELPRTFTGSVENIDKSLMNFPDFVVLDLDPYMYSGKESKGEEPELHEAAFKKVCEIALILKETLDQLKLNTFVKTSGRTGLHIYIPILRNIDYDIVRKVAETIGRHLVNLRPNEVTMDWAVKKRTGKIFFDYNMNARGKTLPSPYSPRNSKQATVSVPVDWSELSKIYPTDFTIWTVPERLEKKGDIWTDILDEKNDLEKYASAQSASKGSETKKRSK